MLISQLSLDWLKNGGFYLSMDQTCVCLSVQLFTLQPRTQLSWTSAGTVVAKSRADGLQIFSQDELCDCHFLNKPVICISAKPLRSRSLLVEGGGASQGKSTPIDVGNGHSVHPSPSARLGPTRVGRGRTVFGWGQRVPLSEAALQGCSSLAEGAVFWMFECLGLFEDRCAGMLVCGWRCDGCVHVLRFGTSTHLSGCPPGQ